MKRKLRGLKKAVGRMTAENLSNGFYVQVHYDVEDDVVLAHEFVSFGHNSFTDYENENIIFIGDYDERVTMAKLRSDIIDKLEHTVGA
ncbi:hypothetical protein [uncultured Mitsuokella sp.]|uniref:hypothetical protein n=1 Tax=uncultured Mitsuokella sp. TaxID=453120 RepID=UPI002619F88A|nr:hypothetical protein [uncultured Mitsuokella sp.]